MPREWREKGSPKDSDCGGKTGLIDTLVGGGGGGGGEWRTTARHRRN